MTTQAAIFTALFVFLGIGFWMVVLSSIRIGPGRWKVFFVVGVLGLNLSQALLPTIWQSRVSGLDRSAIAAAAVMAVIWTASVVLLMWYAGVQAKAGQKT